MFHHVSPWQFEEPRSTNWVLVNFVMWQKTFLLNTDETLVCLTIRDCGSVGSMCSDWCVVSSTFITIASLTRICQVSELLSNLTYHHARLLSCSRVGWTPAEPGCVTCWIRKRPSGNGRWWWGHGAANMFQKTDRRDCYAMTTSLSLRKHVFMVIKDSKNQKQRQHAHRTALLHPWVTGESRHQRSSLLLLALGCRPSKNRKAPPELELKARHTVIATSQSLLMTSRSGILDSGNAHTLPATGHGRGVSPKLDSDWFGAMAAGFVQKT